MLSVIFGYSLPPKGEGLLQSQLDIVGADHRDQNAEECLALHGKLLGGLKGQILETLVESSQREESQNNTEDKGRGSEGRHIRG